MTEFNYSAEVENEQGRHDITEALATMYDAIIGSMDWGSNFLDREDAEAILKIGRLCGFDDATYLDNWHHGVLLLDDEGEPLNDLTYEHKTVGGTYKQSNGVLRHVVSASRGARIEVKDVRVLRDGVVRTVRYYESAKKTKDITLGNPVEVWSTEPTSFNIEQ